MIAVVVAVVAFYFYVNRPRIDWYANEAERLSEEI